jgi:glycerate-2-kinase
MLWKIPFFDIVTEGISDHKTRPRQQELAIEKIKVFRASHPIPDEYGYAELPKWSTSAEG